MYIETKVPDVCERDIDLLLLEEAAASPAFSMWLTSRAGFEGQHELIEARRSVVTDNGESDLEFTFQMLSCKRVRFLVENKVDSALEPYQAERYTERASRYVQQNICDEAITMIVARDVHFGADKAACKFQIRLT